MKKILLTTLCFLSALFMLGQNRTVTGRVTSAEGSPVPFATVTVKGTSTAVSADENGNFSIQAPANAVLVFSSTGYQTSEVNIGTETIVNATLSGTGALEAVVVTALGIRRADRSLGYSVSKVNPDNLLQKSEPDVLKSLQGKVAGVDIRSSQGTPGAATRIQIRGNNSFFGNSEPLIVVDGIPYSNDQLTTTSQVSNGGAYSSGIANLDPNDIASINVLKGSSAAALYGSRASNGVIVITTKSGSGRRTRGTEINFKSSFSQETIANLPDYQNEYGAGSQMAYSNANGSWGPAFGTLDSIAAWPSIAAAYPELFPTGKVAYRPYPNNVKDLFRKGFVYENSVNVSGGDEKSSVGVTASHLFHKGYVYNSDLERANLALGASTKLNIGINVSGNFSYSRANQQGGFFGENQVSGTASSFARSLFLARNWDLNLPFEDKNGLPLQPNVTGYDNPRWSAKYNTIKTNEERIVAGAHFDFTIYKWIRFDYTVGSNVARIDRREVTEIGSRAASGLGRLVLDNYRKQELESNLLVTLTPNIHKDVSLKVLVGNNINQRTITDAAQTGNQFITKGIYTLSNTAQQQFTTDFYSRQRIIGVFGDITLGYKNFAFLNGTLRNDWSSTLPVENRSYLYPSVSGSLIVTDALNIKSDIVDFAKLRAGWAKVGRDATPYSLDDVYTINPGFMGIPSATLPSTANSPDLKPEFTQEVELGTQISFAKRRVELDFTWYNRKSTNLIAIITTPPSSGYLAQVTNFGGIRNRGVEIDLMVRPVRGKNFSWDVHGIFTHNENVVTELTSGVDRIQMAGIIAGINPYLEPGLPFGYLRGTVSARDAEGNLLIDPITGWTITADEEQMIGDPTPDFKLGVTNTLRYKGLSLNVLWDWTKGGDLYSVTVASLLGRGVTLDTRDRQTSWIIPGVYGDPNNPGQPLLVNGHTVANHTVVTSNDVFFSAGGPSGSFGINSATEWNVFDATVYHLREVTLAYDIPKRMWGKLPFKAITLSLSGRNLWHLAPNMPKYTNFDPEVNSFGNTAVQGIELSAAPTTRRFGFNMNISF
ncbi:MAG TPA: SusC/RagA family TonB-linked outer membrane protein [Chitinophagaceae bacterium]|nr:SusC/RagA family TonB-linked outer membrane protein [Chitinophagaceae bacterium]